MRRHVHTPHFGHKLFCVVSLVSRQRDALPAFYTLGQQQRRIALRRAVALQQLCVDHQPIAVFDHHIAAVGQLRFMPAALAR